MKNAFATIIWVGAILSALCGVLVIFFGMATATTAPQEAVVVALGIAFAVIPYCVARATNEILNGIAIELADVAATRQRMLDHRELIAAIAAQNKTENPPIGSKQPEAEIKPIIPNNQPQKPSLKFKNTPKILRDDPPEHSANLETFRIDDDDISEGS